MYILSLEGVKQIKTHPFYKINCFHNEITLNTTAGRPSYQSPDKPNVKSGAWHNKKKEYTNMGNPTAKRCVVNISWNYSAETGSITF